MGEVADLVTRTAEARQDFSADVVEDVHLLGAAVHDVKIALLLVGRERDPPGGAALVRKLAGLVWDRDVAHEAAVLAEHLDPVTLPVARIDEPGIAHVDAVHDLGEHARHRLLRFLVGRLPSPLPQELAVLVEHHDAAVAIAVGDEDIAVVGIDHDRGRHVELVLRGILALALAGAVDRIELEALADLQDELPGGIVLLDHRIAVAGDPDIAREVDKAAMDRARHGLLVAPRGDDVAGRIELDDRRGGGRGLLLLLGDVGAVDDEDVVALGIHTDAAEPPGDPVAG